MECPKGGINSPTENGFCCECGTALSVDGNHVGKIYCQIQELAGSAARLLLCRNR
jgi:hypothetical protein